MNDFYTPAEVADLLKLKKNTVYEMIKRGDLKASKLGKQLRIRKEDLDDYLGQGSSTPAHSSQAMRPAASPVSPVSPALTASPAPAAFPSQAASPVQTPAEGSIIICGQDTILDKLCDKFNALESSATCLRSRKGSYNALYALYHRQVNIATCHLYDPETKTYNLPYIDKLLPGMPVKVFHILNRVQGFYVSKGNPKSIRTFEDFRRPELLFVNREPGCGTRVLLDSKLKELQISPETIQGYYTEMTSHLECATRVSLGLADFALGNEKASYLLPDIEFIPLQTESYDCVIPERFLENEAYQSLLSILRSKDFAAEVAALGGYDVTDMGKEIL